MHRPLASIWERAILDRIDVEYAERDAEQNSASASSLQTRLNLNAGLINGREIDQTRGQVPKHSIGGSEESSIGRIRVFD